MSSMRSSTWSSIWAIGGVIPLPFCSLGSSRDCGRISTLLLWPRAQRALAARCRLAEPRPPGDDRSHVTNGLAYGYKSSGRTCLSPASQASPLRARYRRGRWIVRRQATGDPRPDAACGDARRGADAGRRLAGKAVRLSVISRHRLHGGSVQLRSPTQPLPRCSPRRSSASCWAHSRPASAAPRSCGSRPSCRHADAGPRSRGVSGQQAAVRGSSATWQLRHAPSRWRRSSGNGTKQT
jgi:hypothetical protein